MTTDVTMLLMVAVLVSAGIYLMLERTLTRVLLGILLLGNGVNVLILTTGGPGGLAPLVGAQADPHGDRDFVCGHGVLARHDLPFVVAFACG